MQKASYLWQLAFFVCPLHWVILPQPMPAALIYHHDSNRLCIAVVPPVAAGGTGRRSNSVI